MTEAGTADGGYDAQRLFDNNDFMMSAALTGDTRSTKCRSRSFLLLQGATSDILLLEDKYYFIYYSVMT